MKDLIKLYLDPQESESVGSVMLDAMNKQESDSSETVPESKTDETPKTKFAWGEEDRRKEKYQPKDEDEFDLGYEIEDGDKKVPAKAKLSEIRSAAKFLKENRDMINASLGMREEFKKNPDLGKAFTSFWENSFKDNKYNPEFVGKMSNFLEGKTEVVKEKIEENTDDIKEMETLLNELDADSPQARILRTNINGLKATRAQLKEALGTIKGLQERTDGHDKFKTGFEETQKKNKESEEAKQAGKVFDDTLGALTSKDNKQGYQFEDQDDAKEFEGLVRDGVANLAKAGKITNDSEFIKAIQDVAKAVHERISKRTEKIVNGYLKKKGQPPLDRKPEGNKEKTNKDSDDDKSIGELISESMFSKES